MPDILKLIYNGLSTAEVLEWAESDLIREQQKDVIKEFEYINDRGFVHGSMEVIERPRTVPPVAAVEPELAVMGSSTGR